MAVSTEKRTSAPPCQAKPAPAWPVRCPGRGRAISHHGELLQGVFADRSGELHPALVTLPLPTLVATAEFRPHRHLPAGTPRVSVHPHWKHKARAAAELLLREHVPCSPGGELVIHDTGTPPGVGLGTSTCDVTAALRAAADCYGLDLPGEHLARLAVRAEGASDSVMVDNRVVLFGQRSGRVLEELGPALPAMVLVSCDTDPTHTGVDTLSMPLPEYTPEEVGKFRVLLGALRHALATGSLPLLARVAQASALINQRRLPTRGLATLRGIADRTGGLGVQVSHSGTVAGIIFDPARPDTADRAGRCAQLLDEHGFGPAQILHIPSPAGAR